MTVPENSANRSRLALALGLGLLPLLALVWRFDFVCDDAYISYRYARNFARGLGLVFNPGVEPPVEGYSEFLWVLLMAIPERLGADPAVFSRVLSVASGIALIAQLARRLHTRYPDSTVAPVGATLFLATLPPLAVWATGGMATLPFAWAVFSTYDALFGVPDRPKAWRAALFASLAVLLRADGAWWVFAVGGAGLAVGALRDKALLRASFVAALASFVVFCAHVAWRYATYGDYLPNTARVKLGVSLRALERGLQYLSLNALTMPSIALALLLGLFFWGRSRRAGALPALAPVAATIVYVLLVGGDFMCFARFLVPALPFVAVLLAPALAGLEARAGRVVAALVSLGLATLSLLPAYDVHPVPRDVLATQRFRWNAPGFETEFGQWRRMRGQAEIWRDLGIALAEHSRPDDTLVYGAVGCVGYYSDLFIYDRNGLVNREVALRPASDARRSPGHDKGVMPQFFAKYSPTYLDAFLWPLARPLPPNYEQRDLHGPLRTEAVDPREGPLGLYVEWGDR